MLPLADLQQAFAAAITGADPAEPLLASVAGRGLDAGARLAVYRNHFRVSLADALAATFPIVRDLVGEDFFRGIARRYVDDTPPRQPVLAEYGGTFGDFLAGQPDCAALPYLPDVARFEWLMVRAHQAPDVQPLLAASLADIAPDRLVRLRLCLHGSVGVLASAWPIHRIWAMHRTDWDGSQVSLDEGGVMLLVGRTAGDVTWRVLEGAEAAFIAAIADSATLGDACGAVVQAGGDPGLVLARFLADGILASL
jgi:hypothetical protein